MLVGPLVGTLIDVTGKDYRLTFSAGGLLALGSLGIAVYVHNQFLKLGGPQGYIPPDPSATNTGITGADGSTTAPN
jgi:hypothetical protein